MAKGKSKGSSIEREARRARLELEGVQSRLALEKIRSDLERTSAMRKIRDKLLEEFTSEEKANERHKEQQRYRLREAQNVLLQYRNGSERKYDVARPDANIPFQSFSSASSTQEVMAALRPARELARDVVRNDPIGKHALRLYVNQWWGTGITPRCQASETRFPKIEDRIAVNRRFLRIWKKHAENPKSIDADGKLDWYGLWALFVRTVGESGECLMIKRWRSREFLERKKLALPIQFQVLEADWLNDNLKEWPTRGGAVNRVVGGIEFDRFDQVVAYHILVESESLTGTPDTARQSIRFPADEVIHYFKVERAGQKRGISDFAQIIHSLFDLSDVIDTALKRAKLENGLMMILGIVPGSSQEDTTIGTNGFADDDADYDPPSNGAQFAAGDQGTDSNKLDPKTPISAWDNMGIDPFGRLSDGDGAPMETIRSGQVGRVPKGTDVNTINPTPSAQLEGFTAAALRRVAGGVGILYESLSGNWKDSNFSSSRQAQAPMKTETEKNQWDLTVRALADAYGAIVEAGYTMSSWYETTPSGRPIAANRRQYWTIDELDAEDVRWVNPEAPSSDPERDAKAKSMRLAMRELQWADMIESQGRDPREEIIQMAEFRDYAKTYGIDMDKIHDVFAKNVAEVVTTAERNAEQ